MMRKRIVFSGRVQGVGFRFTAIQYARQFGLTGWVKNMYDGTVLMEVQGESYVIDKLIDCLKNDRFIRIDSMDQKEISVIENDRGFDLKGW